MKAPEQIALSRLLLRRPTIADVNAIFSRYSTDPEVCQYLAWPMHKTVKDTHLFLQFSDAEWERTGAGPYLVFSKVDKQLRGSTGISIGYEFEASVGYVLARDSWGSGYATEALCAMRDLSSEMNVSRIYAHVHPQHRPSRHVLEKAGFTLDGTLRSAFEFPNLSPGKLLDVVSYSWRPSQ